MSLGPRRAAALECREAEGGRKKTLKDKQIDGFLASSLSLAVTLNNYTRLARMNDVVVFLHSTSNG